MLSMFFQELIFKHEINKIVKKRTMSGIIPLNHLQTRNHNLLMPRRQSFNLPGRLGGGPGSDWDCLGRIDPRRLPSILSMRLCEWIDLLTHPITGAFPSGISPKQMDQLASSQIANSALEHGVVARPLWKTGNHLGVLLWNDVKAGRIQRLQKACYVGKSFGKLVSRLLRITVMTMLNIIIYY